MGYSVSEGAIYTAQKVVIYGPEGIGKTTLARQFPGAVFVDVEESSKGYNVRRITRPDGGIAPTSWTMLMDMVKAVRSGEIIDIKTLVIDSADWAETLAASQVCTTAKKDGIEDFGYGKGYTYLEETFGKLLNLLNDVVARGINVVMTAHATMRRVELPEETGAYDHWELKLEKKDAALLKEWADMVLFCNYKTIVVKGANPMEKNKAAGGKRVIYTTHTPWWDAKNRHNLPEEIDMDFSGIAHLFAPGIAPDVVSPASAPVPAPAPVSAPVPDPKPAEKPLPFYDSSDPDVPEQFLTPEKQPAEKPQTSETGIPKALADLMAADGITVDQVQAVVAKKGYYPAGTPIKNYDPQFISGCLVACWGSVKSQIR